MDARIAKTRARLQDALFELAAQRGIDEVSIGDIAAQAGVNRTTFYLHYGDKETLLADALDLVAARAGADLGTLDPYAADPPAPLIDFLVHVDAHAELYRRIFTEPGYGVVLARLRSHMVAAIERIGGDLGLGDKADVPLPLVAAGMAGAILGVMGTWLDADERATAQEAARWIWAVVPMRPSAADQASAANAS